MEMVRRRFWVESGVALGCGVLAVVTLLWRDWIEALTGLDSDHHNGWVEWLVVVGLATCCVVASFAVRIEWRRARPALSTSA